MVSKVSLRKSPKKSLVIDEIVSTASPRLRRLSSSQPSGRSRKISEKSASSDGKSSTERSRRNSKDFDSKMNVSGSPILDLTVEDSEHKSSVARSDSARKKGKSKTRRPSENSNESEVGPRAIVEHDQDDTPLLSLGELTIAITDDDSSNAVIRFADSSKPKRKSRRKSESDTSLGKTRSFAETPLQADSSPMRPKDDVSIAISDDESSSTRIRLAKPSKNRRKSRRKSDSETSIVKSRSFAETPMEVESSPVRLNNEKSRSSKKVPSPLRKGPKNDDKALLEKIPSSQKKVIALDSPVKPAEKETSKAKKKRYKKSKKGSKGSPGVSGTEPLENGIRKKDNSSKPADSEVTVRRRGGGTIIESRPVFSHDAKYVYVNCGWGVRVFSVETGECVRVFDAYSKDHKVVTCFCWNSLPAALTSEGVFIAWDPRSGRVQQKVRLHVKESALVVDGFFLSCADATILCVVVESKRSTHLRIYSESNFRSLIHPLSSRTLGYPYNLHHISVGGDPKKPFIAFINADRNLKIVNLKNKSIVKKSQAGNGKHWTCVRCHPTEDAVAVGDSIGRIVIYRNLRAGGSGKTSLIPSIYHWHTLPVSEIAFTPAGSSMYSGGGELTLVKWNVENPNIRNYLPRLSADIVHIAISPYNQMVAVATLDNGVQIVTPNNKLQCILQQLSWSVFSGEHEGMFPAGLLYDPRSRGLILNGRPGHLQIYSPLSETLTYNIDVTMMNYLTQERDKVIVNTHVTHSALTSDGLWLATVETRYEPGLALELRLKFWRFSTEKKKYTLTTVIDMPHDGKVHSIKFSPGPTGTLPNDRVGLDHEVVLVSTGADRKMRLWSETPFDSIYRKGNTWRCQNACFYKDQPCGPCSFSFDGSILGVGFGSALTLWDVENVVLKHSLARGSEHLKFVEFGRDTCCNILMCATEGNIVAWDLLTLSLVWKVDLKATMFVPDPYSSFVAIFTADNQWKIIDGRIGEVVYTMNNEGKSEVSDRPRKQQVLAAIFAPRHRPNTEAPHWLRNSYLYYIDIYQELNCLEPANEIAQLPTFQLALDKEAGTLFGSLVNAKSVRETADEEHAKTAVGYGVLGSQAVTQLLRPGAHTLPPVSLLCSSLLQSFVIMKRDTPDESDREDKSEDDKTTVVASSDSENEVAMPSFPDKSQKKKKSGKSAASTPGAKMRNSPSASSPSRSPEEMETDAPADLSKHFPLLDEDEPAEAIPMFVIDE